ncbi:hypothetical protein QBC35DRAFT_195702 [Podospora australis]|uniref:Transcription factor tau subunit sfc6 n=1 Tax=Podospora australis TaxID=1536484 RepID=A0AAN6WVK0_9PEZI|nr:hypothetical protein QBC35DRAFT_195702 [Podospora australis]
MGKRTTRGIRKSYAPDPADIDDDELIPVPEIKKDKDDHDFAFDSEGAPVTLNDEEDGVAVLIPTSDEEASAAEGKGPAAADEAATVKKKVRNSGAGMIQSRKGFHDIPHYPLETRIVTRVYAGPLRRYARYSALRDAMYGPESERIRIIWSLEIRWLYFPILPPRTVPENKMGIMPSPWVPPNFERDQENRATRWYNDYALRSPESQQTYRLPDGANRIPRANGGLATFVGPWDKQKQYRLVQGDGLSIAPSGLPTSDEDTKDKTPSGWIFDVGGIPLSIAWAPLVRGKSQVLAVATIPFSDQESGSIGEVNFDDKAEVKDGSVQFWEFLGEPAKEGELAQPSTKLPRLLGAMCFEWGRPKRLQFCPVPIAGYETPNSYGLLAILCGDGRARVLDIGYVPEEAGASYDFATKPVVEFGLSDDYNLEVTCLTWVNINRIALGHTDGSITLWSVYPRALLQRHSAHTTYVIDIASAYPSNPHLVASIPVGGCATLTDLSQPSSEFTYFPVPAISFQPNLLCWNEAMQGFMALYPSSTPNTTIAFLHHRFFCQARSICTGPNTLTCVSSGTTHPFILVGCADGSVFSCNALQKLFKQKGEPLRKIKLFEHEYRPIENAGDEEDTPTLPRLRGATRILQGYLPEVNDDPRSEKRKEMDRKKRLAKKKAGGKRRGRPKKNPVPEAEAAAAAAAQAEEEEDLEAELQEKLASRVVIHEPLTRVTAVAWNPNVNFSCWAACAMASGLIKIMDLGVSYNE